ncbi:BglG family transcription antiterminator [Paenibacillus donghaensis]|uniref:BglG family transcription antiterminator n=1 Tax=Paenibacillus donghaensis TaxID=414771 RepID=UPI001FE3564C|nr:PRD domain-containing protein [Paenibacillus donghaensis]
MRNSDFLERIIQQEDLFSAVPNTPEERMSFILFKLTSSLDYISMESLADEVYVSKTTISYDIKKIIEFLKPFPNLELGISPVSGLYLYGTESAKRIVLGHMLSREKLSEVGSVLLKLSNLLVTDNIKRDLFRIYDMIVVALNEAGYSMTDNDLNLLTVDFLLSCKRIQLGFNAEFNGKSPDISSIVSKFVTELERIFNIRIGVEDRIYLQQSFKAKRVMKMNNEDFVLDEETRQVTTCLLDEIRQKYGYDFSANQTFISNLSLHLNSMIHRFRRGQYDDNPLKEEVKKNYSLAFEIATLIIPILKEKLDVLINESELTFIALHIAVALEEKLEKQRVAILCGSGLSTAQLVKRRLLSHFGDQMNIVGHFPLYQLPQVMNKEFGAVHLIITTLPIQGNYDIPIIQVNPLVTREDLDKIAQYIDMSYYPLVMEEKGQEGLRFLDDQLFERFNGEDYFESIANLCRRLQVGGYIENEKKFYDSVLEREGLFSTIMDSGVAIPHPMEAASRTSIVAVGTFKNPIRHQGRKIKLVLLFAVNTKEREMLAAMYGKIEALLDSPAGIAAAASAEKFSDFLKVLKNV